MAVETKLGAEKPPSNKDGQLLPQELVGGAHGDVFLERSARLSSITKKESLVVCSVRAALLPPLITGTATAASTSPRAERRVIVQPLQGPCVPCSGCFAAKQPSRGPEGPQEDQVLTSLKRVSPRGVNR